MKTILIEQVANGWIVRDKSNDYSNTYKLEDVHVYRSVGELQADLRNLLMEEPLDPRQPGHIPFAGT